LRKFLIVRFSSIGDIVLTSPVIRCLKQQVPDCEVHFLTRDPYKIVLEHHPLIDRLWSTSGDLEDVLPGLKQEGFEAIIDLHHNLRSLKLKRALGITSHSFRKLNIEKWMLVNLKVNRLPDVHIVERYLETVHSYGVSNDNKGLEYYSGPGSEAVLDRLPESHKQGYLAIAIGAQHSTKILPSDKTTRIIQMLGKPVVLLGGKEDHKRGVQLSMAAPETTWNACGQFSLGESAEVIRHASVVLTHDTGLMHIASAFRKPIVSVWGNTVPAFGMWPYLPGEQEKSIIIEAKDLACRPCSKIGFEKCPKSHFNCMRELSEKEIVEAILRLWG